MIVGICGLIGSGKGTVADLLVGRHGFTKVSFADSLKDCVAAVFGWPRAMLEGDTDDSRAWREQVDQWWADRLGMPNLTPRWALQYWGTEVCRKGFHNDLWVASIENRLRTDPLKRYVIPDTRFPNEIDAIRSMGGTVWRVTRGMDPDWLSAYIKHGTEPTGVHESEWRWAHGTFDATIRNDGTFEDLRQSVEALVGTRE